MSMVFKNWKIGKKLSVSFLAITSLLFLLTFVSYNQSSTLHEQTNLIYNHPLKVRQAIADIEINLLRMQIASNNLLYASNGNERASELKQINKSEIKVEENFRIIKERYLGNKAGVDSAYLAYKLWHNEKSKQLTLLSNGHQIGTKHLNFGSIYLGTLNREMYSKLGIISDSSKRFAESLYENSVKIFEKLGWQLAFISFLIILIASIISYHLGRLIRLPIRELHSVTNKYRMGDLSVRSNNESSDEIGELSASFNQLLDNIETEKLIAAQAERVSGALLIAESSHDFFKHLLPILCKETNSQLAAIYLPDESKKIFSLYESVGLQSEARKQVFSAENYEGEFGVALLTKKTHYIKQIPDDTVFVYNAVSGSYIPKEIVTIPILSNNEVIAMLSLASVSSYTDKAIELLSRSENILNARIEGILAYREIRKYSKKIQQQNSDLEVQRNELTQQSVELNRQNNELEIQKNELKASNSHKTMFLSNMSHELRTPLNSVIALSGVLSRRLKPHIQDEEYSYIGIIERNGKHLLSLINDILDISRIEAGREELEITAFDMQALLTEIIELILPQAIERDIRINNTNTVHITIQSDRKKTLHILQNLISNAIKFTEKGSVEIAVTKTEKEILIHITDTGIGIAAEHIHHIFDEFRQADNSTSRRFGGTGLGLAIASKYAQFIGGKITVESQVNKGSVFTLHMPLELSPLTTHHQPAIDLSTYCKAALSPTTAGTQEVELQTEVKRILLVEDSEAAVIQIKDVLERNNMVVDAVSSGTEALANLNRSTPDAIILDLMMPRMDGFDLLKQIREEDKTKHVPVLILTAKHITKADLQFLKSNHIHQLMQKGDVNVDELLHEVKNMVYASKKTHQDTTKSTQVADVRMKRNKFSTDKLSVLIVEDNPDNMTTVKAIIADKYRIFEATNGIEGVQMATMHLPDLILMDIALPELDGIKAFKEIRSNATTRKIPIIAITASAMHSDREIILSHGFEAYIPKPIDEEVFFSTINSVMYGA